MELAARSADVASAAQDRDTQSGRIVQICSSAVPSFNCYNISRTGNDHVAGNGIRKRLANRRISGFGKLIVPFNAVYSRSRIGIELTTCRVAVRDGQRLTAGWKAKHYVAESLRWGAVYPANLIRKCRFSIGIVRAKELHGKVSAPKRNTVAGRTD